MALGGKIAGVPTIVAQQAEPNFTQIARCKTSGSEFRYRFTPTGEPLARSVAFFDQPSERAIGTKQCWPTSRSSWSWPAWRPPRTIRHRFKRSRSPVAAASASRIGCIPAPNMVRLALVINQSQCQLPPSHSIKSTQYWPRKVTSIQTKAINISSFLSYLDLKPLDLVFNKHVFVVAQGYTSRM